MTATFGTIDIASAKQFALAGCAILTVINNATSNRYTYKISKCKDENTTGLFFVGVLAGPDNTSSYQYLGTIRVSADGAAKFDHGRKSHIRDDAPSARAMRWLWPHIEAAEIPSVVELWHAGRCGRCGRLLTVPESVASGYGPECIGKI